MTIFPKELGILRHLYPWSDALSQQILVLTVVATAVPSRRQGMRASARGIRGGAEVHAEEHNLMAEWGQKAKTERA